MVNVWIDREIKHFFDFQRLNVRILEIPVQELVQRFFRQAHSNDILILPYFSSYLDLVLKVRFMGVQGPIIFLNQKTNRAVVSHDMLSKRVLFINLTDLMQKDIMTMIRYIIANEAEKFDLLSTLTHYDLPKIGKSWSEKEAETLKKEELEVKTFLAQRNYKTIFYRLLDDKKSLRLSFSYFYKKIQKQVDINLITKLSRIHPKNFLILNEVKPKINLKDLIKGNDTVKLSFQLGKISLSCNVRVSGVKDSAVLVTGFPSLIEEQKRQFVRIPFQDTSTIKVILRAKKTPTIEVDVHDISEGGFSFVADDMFSVGTYLSLSLPVHNSVVLCEGIVRHKMNFENQYRYGVEFEMQEIDLESFVSFIYRKQLEYLL